MASGSLIRYTGKRGVVWRIKYRDADSRQVMETIGPDRRDAERELRRRLVDIERDGFRKPRRLGFAEFAERWFSEYLPARNLKPTSVQNYRISIERHLVPFFRAYDLVELEARPELIDRYVTEKTRQGLSPKTISNQLTDLNVMLKQAVRWKLIRSNPVAGVERPRVETPEMQVLTEAEIRRLRVAFDELEAEACEQERAWWRLARTIVLVGLGTALRRGELLALRWRDVGLLDGLLLVRQAYVRGRFTTPKSRSSRRTIEVGPRTLALLESHWRTSAFQGDDELVFCHPERGTPVDPSKLARAYLRPALERAGVDKPFRPFHDLRHTSLTHEAAAGNPQAYVQLKAGHSQGAITERYIHAAQVLFPGAAAKGEERMFGADAHKSVSGYT